MFDDTKTYQIPVPARLGSDQLLHVRWPTDEEWFTRIRKRKLTQRKLGRGRTETHAAPPGDADLELYDAICLNGSPKITAGEAQMLLDSLAVCTVTGVRIEDNEAVVDLQIVTGEATHWLKIPTADQIFSYRRAGYRLIEMANNQQEIRLNPQHGAALWDSCGGHSTDYKGAIPGIHKDQAIKGILEFVDSNLGPRIDDPNS